MCLKCWAVMCAFLCASAFVCTWCGLMIVSFGIRSSYTALHHQGKVYVCYNGLFDLMRFDDRILVMEIPTLRFITR